MSHQEHFSASAGSVAALEATPPVGGEGRGRRSRTTGTRVLRAAVGLGGLLALTDAFNLRPIGVALFVILGGVLLESRLPSLARGALAPHTRACWLFAATCWAFVVILQPAAVSFAGVISAVTACVICGLYLVRASGIGASVRNGRSLTRWWSAISHSRPSFFLSRKYLQRARA